MKKSNEIQHEILQLDSKTGIITETKMRKQQQPQSELTSKELKVMGERLLRNSRSLEIITNAIEVNMLARVESNAEISHKLLDSMYYALQDVMDDAEEIGYTLAENDNADEVEAMRERL